MTYKYSVPRYNGEETNFDFSGRNPTAEQIAAIIKDLVPDDERQALSFNKDSKLYKALLNGSDVWGTWQSSDSEIDDAAVDIQNKIREDLGIETTVSMYDSEGNTIRGECYGGKFLIRKTSR